MKIIKNDTLRLEIDEHDLTLAVTDLRSGKRWRMRTDGAGDIGIKGHCGPYQAFMFRDAKNRSWTALSETSARATFTGWPYAANVWSPLGLGLTVDISLAGDAVKIALAPCNNDFFEASVIDSFYPRGFLFPEKSAGDLVLPCSQGCLLDKDTDLDLDMVLPGYVGFGFIMPWWGQLCADGSALIALTDTPDDLGFRIHCDRGCQGATVGPYWQASLGGFKYRRSMTYRFLGKTDVMGLAKAYRKHADGQGQAITLREKAAERPAVDKLIGGPFMNMWFMSTFSRHDLPSRVNFMRFSEGLRRYRKLCAMAGVGDRGIAHIDGWCRDGYDFNHPEPLPPDIRLGSWQGFRELRDGVRDLGHAFVLHDNYVDYYKHTDAYRNDEGVMNLDGIKHASTEWLGGPQEWLCSTRSLKYLRQTYDGLAVHDSDIDGIYLDCWSVGHLRECYDPSHPATRTTTRKAWSEAMAFCRNRGSVVGSESGNDWAVPVMDYCHTVQTDIVPHVLVGKVASFGKSIPLYNMVWHDCLVCPAWACKDPDEIGVVKDGMVVPVVKDQRLWALLWGGPPSFRTTATMEWRHAGEKEFREDAEFIASLKPIWEFSGVVGYEPIVEWQMLAADSSVQRTVFADGSTAEVDFSSGAYRLKVGKKAVRGCYEQARTKEQPARKKKR
jgi:hypothetical protein